MEPDGVNVSYFKFWWFYLAQNSKFEISNVYDIGLLPRLYKKVALDALQYTENVVYLA